MYCPQCGSEASIGLQYCRSCGLALSQVEAALNDKLTAAAEQLQRGSRAVKIGLFFMVLFAIMAIIAAASSGPFGIIIGSLIQIEVTDWAGSLMVALMVGIPAVALGYRRIRRVAQQLHILTTPNLVAAGRAPQLDDGKAPVQVGDGKTRPVLEGGAGAEDPTARLRRTSGNDL